MLKYFFVTFIIILGLINLLTNYKYLPYYFILLPILAFYIIYDDAEKLK
jgi:hypothetical protein